MLPCFYWMALYSSQGGEGSGVSSATTGSFSGERFLPPYLDSARKPATIIQFPNIAVLNAPGANAETFSVLIDDLNPGSHTVDRIVLTRPAAVTHFFDADQRYIELAFTGAQPSGDEQLLTVTCPQQNLGPPGFYLLWVITRDNVNPNERTPSRAVIMNFQ